MNVNRRAFLKTVGGLSAAGAAMGAAEAWASSPKTATEKTCGVLVDLTLCVGCRHCEYACRKANGIEAGALSDYENTAVFAEQRRPLPTSLTVINRYPRPEAPDQPVYAKINCMHCNHAACVSACIVGALDKQENGAVTYDAWKCIGCRYCMVACPFQIPAYEYDKVLTPEVKKCQFCFHRTGEGQIPACVEGCPRQAMIYGKREHLLRIAHERIAQKPEQYVDHIYGEHEVGGTAWLYLSPVPFERAGFLKLGDKAPPALTEAIQHGVFKYWIAPIALYGFFSAAMFITRAKRVAVETHAAVGAPLAVLAGETPALAAAAIQPYPHHEHPHPAPAGGTLLTPGVWALIAMVAVGAVFGLYRFLFGLEASTNLNQQYPWGLWIAMDVGSGIALAGGGFVTAALVHIFHREHYHAIARSALLTALLGYTFYVPGLLADIGRWYNIWHPTLPSMWQVDSALFEVGICVMLYLNVQYAELAPIICERFMGERGRFPRLAAWANRAHRLLEAAMPALLILGVTLSCFHQSSLGNLMVIAPYKVHPLWWTPLMPVLFLLSAMMVGFPMVIFTMLLAARSLRRQPLMRVLTPLSRYVPVFLTIYLAVKIGDMIHRGTWSHLLDGSFVSASWLAEVALGVALPLAMLLHAKVRQSPRLLAIACLLVILGVVLNRLNVFVIGYTPPFTEQGYFPSVAEFAVSMGLVAALMLTYRVAVTYLPILSPPQADDGLAHPPASLKEAQS